MRRSRGRRISVTATTPTPRHSLRQCSLNMVDSPPMQLKALVDAMEQIAPTRYAETWDNVGLLVGDPEAKLARAMLTIDYTPAVADEAKEAKCDAVIAYHPPIFETLKRVTSTSAIFDAIRRGVAIYSPHTALDAADG